jgi:hypothetical protein
MSPQTLVQQESAPTAVNDTSTKKTFSETTPQRNLTVHDRRTHASMDQPLRMAGLPGGMTTTDVANRDIMARKSNNPKMGVPRGHMTLISTRVQIRFFPLRKPVHRDIQRETVMTIHGTIISVVDLMDTRVITTADTLHLAHTALAVTIARTETTYPPLSNEATHRPSIRP